MSTRPKVSAIGLEASHQTELTEQFPAHIVSAWLGNSERVAAQHYLQVLDSHFQKAARIPARTTPESGVFETHRVTENTKTLGNSMVLALKLGDGGFDSSPPRKHLNQFALQQLVSI